MFLEAAGWLLAVPGGAGVEAGDVHLRLLGVIPGLVADHLVRLWRLSSRSVSWGTSLEFAAT